MNFVITVPGADDVMLNYQSLSHHDVLAVRELTGRRAAPEFEAWLSSVGLADADGRLLDAPDLRVLESALSSGGALP